MKVKLRCLLCIAASRHRQWWWPADKRTSLLRPVGVRGGTGTYQVVRRGPGVAWRIAGEWRHERWWVHGATSAVECHSVCLLHAGRRERIHSRVSHSVYSLCLTNHFPGRSGLAGTGMSPFPICRHQQTNFPSPNEQCLSTEGNCTLILLRINIKVLNFNINNN